MLTGEKLGKQIERARDLKGVTNAEIARQFNVKQPSVQGWIKTGRISKDKLMELINFFSDVAGSDHWGIQSNVIPIQQSQKDTIQIPKLDVEASMGPGIIPHDGYIDVVENLSVNKNYLSHTVSYSNTSNLAIITGFGDSMQKTFYDGDLLLVDRGVNEINLDAVYIVLYEKSLYIKRFQRRPGKPLLMISDNKNYEPIEIPDKDLPDLVVLGRILMTWNANKM